MNFWLFQQSEFRDLKENNFAEVSTCKDYVIFRKITAVLKIAVNNAKLEMCDSRDYFSTALTHGTNQIHLIVPFT